VIDQTTNKTPLSVALAGATPCMQQLAIGDWRNLGDWRQRQSTNNQVNQGARVPWGVGQRCGL
jgi:hypothetical protein